MISRGCGCIPTTRTVAGLCVCCGSSALLAPAQRGGRGGGGHDRRPRIKVHRHLKVLLLGVRAHVVDAGEGALAHRTLGLARVHVPVQCQRHGVAKALPADTAAELEIWRIYVCTRKRGDQDERYYLTDRQELTGDDRLCLSDNIIFECTHSRT